MVYTTEIIIAAAGNNSKQTVIKMTTENALNSNELYCFKRDDWQMFSSNVKDMGKDHLEMVFLYFQEEFMQACNSIFDIYSKMLKCMILNLTANCLVVRDNEEGSGYRRSSIR